nr:hypothetical protein B0A51_15170 [Rachicladosporium sp. CCFEE 5018]
MIKPREEASNYAVPIIIHVGVAKHAFVINQDMLTKTSDYFKTALKECWNPVKGDETFRTVNLKDADEQSFNVYANWLHSRAIYSGTRDLQNGGAFAILIRCYTLGDLLLDGDFKDAIADAFVCQLNTTGEDNMRYFPSRAEKHLLYKSTAPNAKLRQLAVELFAASKTPRLLFEDDPPAFLFAVAQASMIGQQENRKAMFAECKYHEHGEGVDACYRKRLFATFDKPADDSK